MSDLQEAILKLSPQVGDVVFVDADAITPEALNSIPILPVQVTFIFVHVTPGLTLKEVIRLAPLDSIKEHFETLQLSEFPKERQTP